MPLSVLLTENTLDAEKCTVAQNIKICLERLNNNKKNASNFYMTKMCTTKCCENGTMFVLLQNKRH